MAIEINTLMTTTEPSQLAADWNDTVQLAMLDAGAVGASCWVAMSGQLTGDIALSTRWESLGQWATASAAMEARMAGGDLAQLAGRYQIAQRVVGVDVQEAGTTSGPFMSAGRYSFTGPPIGLEHATNLTVGAGAHGGRSNSVISGGEMTGHFIAAMFLNSFEKLPDILASNVADEQFMANAQAAGANLESRTLFRGV
jgi:hypothetical protein